ncbi:MAG: flippase-like domain-containing protein [Cyclobacteriaceae bacterium]|nr:flippase-like domain-containing protein [Cyclobacteriaceae bacterium]MCK5470377.1 flippase-like domain-containing protein [Cyclobacteriaceae bacterium]
MASKTRKVAFDILKYSATLGIAALLLWYVYRDISFESLKKQFVNINYYWIAFSIVMALVSHYLRAYRWNILLETLGYHLKASRTFIAVMVGYFVNNLVPRLGEVSRCGILKKNDNVPMTSAFGSVVAERTLDLLILITIASITFPIEFDRLNQFVIDNFQDKIPNSESIYGLALAAFGIIIALFLLVFILFKLFRDKLHRNPIYLKIRRFTRELLDGFLSIRKIKNQIGFWLSTIGIWLLYYLMLFAVFYAFPPTSNLGLMAGLTILIMSGLGMSAPVQGGIGVFHILVSGVLALYGISVEEGKVFALVAHTTQFMTIMIFGGISFVISVFMKPKPGYAVS